MTAVSVFAEAVRDAYIDAAPWSTSWNIDDVHVRHRVVDGLHIVAFRGSASLDDWLRDADAWPQWHAKLGFVHKGFLAGMDDVYGVLAESIPANAPLAFTGHSLGGAHARVMAALFAVNERKVEELHVFGSPKPAFENLARVIQKSGMKHVSWRNRNDPVPLVPGVLPYWVHSEPYGTFDKAAADDDLDPLRDHFVASYVRGAQDYDERAATAG